MALTLVIGNKNYSSWSMRPWMALKASGIPFNEIFIPLYTGTLTSAVSWDLRNRARSPR